ncbi:MAG: acyltransferase family protein [Pseudomonadota bacterium]
MAAAMEHPEHQALKVQVGGSRRYDLDWLRVLAFGVLIFFHSAVLFLPSSLPRIPNPDPSQTLSVFVAFSHQFRLSLLFLVSGMGVRFALRNRTGRQYLSERTKRLLIPLLFGIAVIVPPMVYLEKLYNDEFSGGFLQFYRVVFTEGVYPTGNLSWHHYWFIAYLFIFCLVTWPLFRRWLGRDAETLAQRTNWLLRGRRIYSVAAPIILIEWLLRPIFPGFHNLITDWANFTHWLVIFIAGFAMAHDTRLLDRCRDLRFMSLTIGLIGSSIVFAQYYSLEHYGFHLKTDITLPNAIAFIWFSIVRIIAEWAWILTCVGFAARYLNRPSRALTYLNGAVYPLFCLHLTTIVALAYLVLPTDLPIGVKFLTLSFSTYAICFALYEGVVRRIGVMGLLVGAKPMTAAPREDSQPGGDYKLPGSANA